MHVVITLQKFLSIEITNTSQVRMVGDKTMKIEGIKTTTIETKYSQNKVFNDIYYIPELYIIFLV